MYFISERHFIILSLLSLSRLYHCANELEVRFCGIEQTCSRNITKHELRNDACCRPCECDDICAEKGTCCRDKKELDDMDLNTKQKCLSSAYIPKNYSEPTGVLSYYNRVSCPKSFNDTNIKAMCEGDILKPISGIIPVSSQDGKIVYKNKYCSYCHGEKETNSWNIIVHRASPSSCERILRQKTLNIDIIKTKILSNCILHFIPPKNIDFWNVLCFEESNIIKQCNVTGKWDTFNRKVNNLCLNQTDNGYYIFKDLRYVYQNVYCSICNNFYYESVEACTNAFGRFQYRPLFTLINVNKLLDERKPRQCGHEEILDTFFNTCRTLYCLWNSFSFEGKCVPFVDYTTKMGYTLVVKLVPIEIMTHLDLTKRGVRNLHIPILEKLNFIDCGICYLAVYADKSIHEIYVNLTFTPTVRCKIEDIWSNFITAETTLPLSLNLAVNDKQFGFKAFWDYPNPFKDYTMYLIQGTPAECHGFAPARGQICPKVKLLKDEVEIVMKHHPRAEELRWVQNENDFNGSTFVCTHNYISYQHSSSSIKCQSCSLIFIVIIVLSLRRCFVRNQL